MICRGEPGRIAALGVMMALSQPVAALAAPTVASIVNDFASEAVASGATPGVEIAVVIGTQKPRFFSFGTANAGTMAAPSPDTLFQIASVTKVFTTNLLGQAVSSGTLSLNDPLSGFSTQLGTLPAYTALVTLQDLGDFTGGFPTLPGFCQTGEKPAKTGCLPDGNDRPTLHQYTGRDLAAFFRTYLNKQLPPSNYLYSDFSLGLLGLLLGSDPNAALSNQALAGWNRLLTSQLLKPLHMTSTFMNVPAKDQPRLAAGYELAQATAQISGGAVAGLTLTASGNGFTTPPAVTISGGGGTGAQAQAQLNGTRVSGFTVTQPGTGYIPPAAVTFSSGSAAGTAIIRNGRVVGVSLQSGGSYTSVPTVTFSGGRNGGHDAQGTVFVDHDAITYVKITDPGAGYVDPVTVVVAPGSPTSLAVPIWAPAGALKSSARNLATFAAAALGQTSIGRITVPPLLSAGFAIAETPYACEKGAPDLQGCTAPKSGLAWDILTAAPETITKDGGLPGYSSVVELLPGQNAAIVVLCNSYQSADVAPMLGAQILSALYHNGLL